MREESISEEIADRRIALYIALMKQSGVIGFIIYIISFFLIINPKTIGDAPVFIVFMVMAYLFWVYHARTTIRDGYRDFEENKKVKRVERKTLFYKVSTYPKTPVVYLLRCGEWYKIGQSSDLTERVRSISTSCPYPIEVVYYFLSNSPKRSERILHDKFESRRGIGEWFLLSLEDVEEIMRITHGD